MRTSKEINALLDQKSDELEAIHKAVKEENREYTDEETAAINAFHGTEENPGEYDQILEDLKRAKKREADAAHIAAMRMGPKVSEQIADQLNGDNPLGTKKVKIPAVAKRFGNLKSGLTPEDAYSSGKWLQAVLGKSEAAADWCQEHGIDIIRLDKNWNPVNVMTEGVNTAGGFLVPTPLENSIIRLVENFGIFRAKAMPWPMTSDTDSFPKRTGGLTRYYPGEAGTITASDATVGRESLLAVKMATLTRISSELNEDSIISITDWLTQEIATVFATGDDEDGFNGDSTSTYGGRTGILVAMGSASKHTAATGNTAFSTLDDTDFLTMMGKLANYTGINPEWYISPEGFHDSMARLVTAAGGVSKAEMEEDLRPRFHGRPVNFVNVMNKTLTAQTDQDGLCYYGDLRMGCTMGVRRGVTIAADSSKYFDTDEIAIRATQRTAVNCHDVGDGSNAGAVVGLTTPSS